MSQVFADLAGEPRRPQLADFRRRCSALTDRDLGPAEALHRWSVEHYRQFWRTLLGWADLAWEGSADVVCTSDDVEHAASFPDVRLNYAENLLRRLPAVSDESIALTAVHAEGAVEHLSRAGLRSKVRATADLLAERRVGVGDRVVVIAANNAGSVAAVLAAAALGATISTAMPNMGPTSLLSRFEQVEPTVLILGRTGFGGWSGSSGDTLPSVLEGLPTLREVLVLDDQSLPASTSVGIARLCIDADESEREPAAWPRLPFNLDPPADFFASPDLDRNVRSW